MTFENKVAKKKARCYSLEKSGRQNRYGIKAFINLSVELYQKKEFYPFIQSVPNVIECNCVTGDYSMLIEVAYQSTVELDHFINVLQRFGHTKTLIVFSTSVEHRDIAF